jgi:HlyD family secretion protein
MANSKSKTRRKIIIFSGIALVLVGLTLLAIFKKREVAIKVQTESVARRNLTELVVANGKIQPVLQVVINPEVSGEITELPVKEGQYVKKGDLLLKIKPDNYRASRNSAQASHQSALAAKTLANANLNKAEIEFKRFEQLLKGKLISDSQYLDAKTTLDVMKATHETTCHQADQAKAALAKAEDDLSKTTIYSPIGGTVTKLKSQVGERVVGTALMAGTEIMTIAELSEMEARVDIGEVDIILIRLGQTARLEVDAFRDQKFTGTVTEIANASKNAGQPAAQQQPQQQQQEATRFEVKIHLKDKEQFRPGMSVTAEIETRYRTNVLAVPIQSVTTRMPKNKDADKKAAKKKEERDSTLEETDTRKKEKAAKPVEVVFLANSPNVKMVPVKRGISDEEYVEIVEGLQEGQTVISGGYKAINRELEEGKKVLIDNSSEKKDEKK